MATQALLRWILIGQAAVITAGIAAVLFRAAWLARRERLDSEQLGRARTSLAAALEDDAIASASEALRHLPRRIQLRLITETAPFLAGRGRERLALVALELGITRHGIALCRGRRWSSRLRGARLLTALRENGKTMAALLSDRHPTVRAQALEWAGDHGTPSAIARLLDALDDPDPLCRFTAQDSLLRLGSTAAVPLARHLENCSESAAENGLLVAEGIAGPPLLSIALQYSRHASPRVRSTAIRVLAIVGGEDGVHALEERLGDAQPEVRASAARALGRLAHWPVAPRIALLLRDRAYPVRREAALALRSLGGPSLLLLRQFRGDADSFAADMARQTLELPHSASPRGKS